MQSLTTRPAGVVAPRGLHQQLQGHQQHLAHHTGAPHAYQPPATAGPRPQVFCAAAAPSDGRSTATASTSGAPPVGPVKIPDYRVSLFDAMRFNGPAPELINGRLAMVGFLAGALEESSKGTPLLVQVEEMTLQTALLLAVLVYASLTPILKGAKMEPFGMFTPRAEVANGRAAMVGLAALLFLEWKAGGVPFF